MPDPTLRDLQSRIRRWHELRGLPVADEPTIPPLSVADLRTALHDEEIAELYEAMFGDTDYSCSARPITLPTIAKELGDCLYVLLGTCATYGLDAQAILEAVIDSNDTKPSTRDSNGKIVKGPDYVPPDMAAVVEGMRKEAERG